MYSIVFLFRMIATKRKCVYGIVVVCCLIECHMNKTKDNNHNITCINYAFSIILTHTHTRLCRSWYRYRYRYVMCYAHFSCDYYIDCFVIFWYHKWRKHKAYTSASLCLGSYECRLDSCELTGLSTNRSLLFHYSFWKLEWWTFRHIPRVNIYLYDEHCVCIYKGIARSLANEPKIRAVFCVSKYVFCFAWEFKIYELKILTPRRLTPLCNTFEISASFYHFIRLKLFCALLMNWQHILCDERTDSTKIKSSTFIFINSVHWLCVCVSVRVRILCMCDRFVCPSVWWNSNENITMHSIWAKK